MREGVAAARLLPVGPHLDRDGAHFRVWAPAVSSVSAVFEDGRELRLQPEDRGYFSGFAAGARDGDRYRFRLDGKDLFPDPASHFQPEGPHGPSQLVDHARFRWSDADWRGARREGQVLYELHVGTFTRAGTWAAAAAELPRLKEVGVTLIEMMPVADFAGRFGWGYDGVCWFAPCRLYGGPDDLKAFVDAAHRLGLGVILDVVYNHFGPVGNYLGKFSPYYSTDRYRTDWGPAVNFDGPASEPVREYVLSNVQHWIETYRFDGLRFDATQNVCDASDEHILAACARRARQAARGRAVFLVAENEPQDDRLLRPSREGGYGFDAMWADDFHHSAEVALTGRAEGYLSGYRGVPQELISALKRGFLYQGQYYAWQKQGRGTPAYGLPLESFVHYLENHDQVGNAPGARRMIDRCDQGSYRALLAALLLGPQTPLLFQGQERGARRPFHFFADHDRDLANIVHAGRRQYLAQFPSLAGPDAQALVPDPSDPATRDSCVLAEDRDPAIERLVRDLLALRREDATLRARGLHAVDGAVLGPAAFVFRYLAGVEDRLLLVNLGADLPLESAAEPLLAPPRGRSWALLWSSQDPSYGGDGTPSLQGPSWRIPAKICAVLKPVLERRDGSA